MTRRGGPSGVVDYLGERAVSVLAWIRGFFRANLPVWIGILVVLFAYYCVMDQQGL